MFKSTAEVGGGVRVCMYVCVCVCDMSIAANKLRSLLKLVSQENSRGKNGRCSEVIAIQPQIIIL